MHLKPPQLNLSTLKTDLLAEFSNYNDYFKVMFFFEIKKFYLKMICRTRNILYEAALFEAQLKLELS